MIKKEIKTRIGRSFLYFGDNFLLQASLQEMQEDVWLVTYHHGTFQPCIQQVVVTLDASDALAQKFVENRHESPADLPTDLTKLNESNHETGGPDTQPGDSPLPDWLKGIDNE